MSLDAGKIFKSVLLAATMACPVYGVIDIRVLPNEVTPKQVILENDSLYMEIHVI